MSRYKICHPYYQWVSEGSALLRPQKTTRSFSVFQGNCVPFNNIDIVH